MMASAPASAMAARVRAASREFVFEDQRVEGDEAAHAAAVQGRHGLRQFLQREAHFGARGEVLEAEIDRVGAGFDGGAQLRPVAGGTHDFGFAHGRHRLLLA